MSQDDSRLAASLRWRCRRGMRELDVLLSSWLAKRWPDADPELQQDFADLLDQEDDQLWDWLLGRTAPPASLGRIVSEVQAAGEDLRPDNQ